MNGKIFKCFTYKGEPAVPSVCHNWLERIRVATEGRTVEKWFNLLKMFSEGDLLSTLNAWEDEGITDPKIIIPWIERCFGGYARPAAARRRFATLERRGNESLTSLDVRITELAKMATIEDPADIRIMNKDALRKTTLLRVIPTPHKNDFMERELARIQRGDDEFGYRETVNELSLIWEKHDELAKKNVNSISQSTPQGEGSEIAYSDLFGEEEEASDKDYSNDEAGDDDDDDHDGIHQVRFPQRRSFNKVRHNKRVSDRHSRGKNQGRYFNKGRRVYTVQDDAAKAEESIAFDETVARYDDYEICYLKTSDGRKARIYASDLGVERDACFKCGRIGHKMSGPGSEVCPYVNEALMSKCSRCNVGGHRPEVCKNAKSKN